MEKEVKKGIDRKILEIKREIFNQGVIFKSNLNSDDNYFFFTEKQILNAIYKFLLEKGVNIEVSDDENKEIILEEKNGIWIVSYWKKISIIDCERDQYSMSEKEKKFSVLALGMNKDISKAKGSAETYALKYFYKNFFGIIVEDNLDPDKDKKKKF